MADNVCAYDEANGYIISENGYTFIYSDQYARHPTFIL